MSWAPREERAEDRGCSPPPPAQSRDGRWRATAEGTAPGEGRGAGLREGKQARMEVGQITVVPRQAAYTPWDTVLLFILLFSDGLGVVWGEQ